MVVPTAGEAFLKGAQHAACVLAPYLAGIGAAAASKKPQYAVLAYPAAQLLLEPFCGPPEEPWPIPAYGHPFLGGQCPESYVFKTNYLTVDDSLGGSGYYYTYMTGPVLEYDLVQGASQNGTTWQIKYKDRNYPNGNIDDTRLLTSYWKKDTVSFSKQSGGPDNCGNPPPIYVPSSGAPAKPYPPALSDPDGNPVLPPVDFPSPYQPPGHDKPIYLPVSTPSVPIPLPISFPITVPISVGGVAVGGINIAFNGTFEISYSSSSPGGEVDLSGIETSLTRIKTELDEVKACACLKPPAPPEVETLGVPILSTSECSTESLPLSVERGALSPAVLSRFLKSAEAAVLGCRAKAPEQKEETLLFSGTSTLQALELYSPAVSPEVISVRLRITNYSSGASREITTFPGTNQRKFGSLGWSNAVGGAGPYQYVFDESTLFYLPPRAKNGYVRLLLKEGISFSLYDTGERLMVK
jgi:hypothetical protein